MLTSFTLMNFKSFEKLTIGPLARVNLIAGKNNVGKTTLLEALWLHHGADNPDLPRRILDFRGMAWGGPEEIFENLFRDFDAEQSIRLTGKGDWVGKERDLIITWQQPSISVPAVVGTQRVDGEVSSTAPTSTEMTPLGKEVIFSYTDEHGKSFVSKGRFVSRPMQTLLGPVLGPLSEIGFQLEQAKIPGRPTGKFLHAYLPGNVNAGLDNANMFGIMTSEKRDEDILDSLKVVEPRLRDLRVVTRGGRPALEGDIGLPKRVSLALMGGGTTRLLQLVLAIATAPEGMVLVDEVENGFHHTIMPKVWETIANFARDFHTQVFATTHSHETIEAAYAAFTGGDATDFRLHRLDRVDSTIRAVTYDLETLGGALEMGLEVR